MRQRFSFLTVSYRGDLKAFSTLCDSIDKFNPETNHYVLVDNSDFPIFERFVSKTRHVINLKNELPDFHELNLPGRRIWFLPWRHVVRGWIYQQIAKIHFTAKLNDDAVLIVDSDAKFVRSVTGEHLFSEGKVFLYRRPTTLPITDMLNWFNAARQSLGQPRTGFNGKDYISTALPWSPEVVRLMIARIEREHNVPWYRYLLKFLRISEYITYGLFCEEMDGPQRELIVPTDRELCHCSWHYNLQDEAELARFYSDIQPDQVAVLIQSNLGMPEPERLKILERFDIHNAAA
jgi:hypothetical protein